MTRLRGLLAGRMSFLGKCLGLMTVTMSLAAGGCGTVFESNQAACRRIFNRALVCAGDVDVPAEWATFVSTVCDTVPEGGACDEWSALANCVTSVPCDELLTNPQPFAACQGIADGLEANGCFPAG